jgi:hypothetical protein
MPVPVEKSVLIFNPFRAKSKTKIRQVTVQAFVVGYLCVHHVYEMDQGDIVPTDMWRVSHVKTGRGACGNKEFESRRHAVKFMRLLQPHHEAWRGNNEYQVSARAVNLYKDALEAMRNKEPTFVETAWVPKVGDKVLVLTRQSKTREESVDVAKIDAIRNDMVRANNLVFVQGQSGGWITRPNKTPKCSSCIVPYCADNVKRFIKDQEKKHVKSTTSSQKKEPSRPYRVKPRCSTTRTR